jgi:putative ABC transport system substrate-binding protein
LGWDDGKNIHVDYRYGVGPQIVNKNAAELVALAPDVILANAPPAVLAVQQATHTIPVVFAAVTDPVALGLVQSLARPGGNVTGFSPAEIGLSAKWLELLKEIEPEVKRVAVFRAASNPASETQISIIETAARAMGVDIRIIDVSDTAAMDRDVADFASAADGGLIAIRTSENVAARGEIIALAARYRLPAVYPLRFFATGGGLVSYGPDIVDEYREAAGYVDRILKGAKPMDLPVQSASKFELTINLKTAKQLGLTIPPSLLATADEVIE